MTKSRFPYFAQNHKYRLHGQNPEMWKIISSSFYSLSGKTVPIYSSHKREIIGFFFFESVAEDRKNKNWRCIWNISMQLARETNDFHEGPSCWNGIEKGLGMLAIQAAQCNIYSPGNKRERTREREREREKDRKQKRLRRFPVSSQHVLWSFAKLPRKTKRYEVWERVLHIYIYIYICVKQKSTNRDNQSNSISGSCHWKPNFVKKRSIFCWMRSTQYFFITKKSCYFIGIFGFSRDSQKIE